MRTVSKYLPIAGAAVLAAAITTLAGALFTQPQPGTATLTLTFLLATAVIFFFLTLHLPNPTFSSERLFLLFMFLVTG